MSAYEELERRFRRIVNVRHAISMLQWDLATVMPPGGQASRAEQTATLHVLVHELMTDPRVGELLESAAASDADLGPWQRANLREMTRAYVHATAIDAHLVEALSKGNAACEALWREARPKSDFAMIRPQLEIVLALQREVAAAKAAKLGLTPYDALLGEWEPDGKSAEIDRVFDPLSKFLRPFLETVLDRQATEGAAHVLDGPFPIERQRSLCEKLMGVVGFDFRHGRLDVSLHPFCGGTPDDVRITTRYSENDFTESLMGVLHETGHALYERGLPADWRYQPVGEPRGMSIHESQSLIIEMQACRSREFLAYLAPLARAAFGASGPSWDAENLYRHYTRVERSLIRVEADEVSYPAHVILRYRLERAMLAGDLAVADLPGAWNDGMEELLGIRPPDDRRGCLQDIHWYDGAWGYFPTYTLGAMTAAQFFGAAKRDDPSILDGIRNGNFGPLVAWLRKHVHGKASLLPASELITEATGRPLDPKIFERHLEDRYLGNSSAVAIG
ncbi:MAG TPA: carboxypeptidase M32 [Alphaproteobacteria bacterium]|nr:carboxypeptidase M32 [Alphaproteobacteria bacterium]